MKYSKGKKKLEIEEEVKEKEPKEEDKKSEPVVINDMAVQI